MKKLLSNRPFLLTASLVMLIGIFLMAKHLLQKSEEKKLSFLAQERSELFVRPYAPVKGAPEAPIFVTEFLDPECESCREISTYVQQLLQEYEGKIKLVVRYAPFHGNSIFAVKILEAARLQGKYWETLELLYRHQPEWGNHHNPRPELIWTYLPELGLDIEKLKTDMESPAIAEIIRQDQMDGQALDVRATPTFFVNGKPLDDYGPEFLKAAIDREVLNLR